MAPKNLKSNFDPQSGVLKLQSHFIKYQSITGMRKSLFTTLCVAFSICMLASCSKDDTNNIGKVGCRVENASTKTVNSESKYVFSYGGTEQKLMSISRSTDSLNGDDTKGMMLFKHYGSDALSVRTTSDSGTFLVLDSFLYLSNRLVKQYHFINEQLSAGVLTTYAYNSIGELVQSVRLDAATGRMIGSTDYVITQGNVTSTSERKAYTYYTEEAYRIGDYLQIMQVLQSGAAGVPNANLVKSLSENGVIANITYSMDANGHITKVIRDGGSNGGNMIIDLKQLCY